MWVIIKSRTDNPLAPKMNYIPVFIGQNNFDKHGYHMLLYFPDKKHGGCWKLLNSSKQLVDNGISQAICIYLKNM